jgi:hypothetical protein
MKQLPTFFQYVFNVIFHGRIESTTFKKFRTEWPLRCDIEFIVRSQKPQEALNLLVTEESCWALFYMSFYTFLHNLLNILVQNSNTIGLQKKKNHVTPESWNDGITMKGLCQATDEKACYRGNEYIS